MYKYAILGFGGLGKLHFKNLLQLERERGDICLTAICGADRKTISNAAVINIGSTDLDGIDFDKYRFYDSVDELLKEEHIDFAISALPTVMHKDVAVKLLNNGVHVFSEKPMALSYLDCIEMVDAAQKNNKFLMIGQCLRFSGCYEKIKECIDNKTFGALLRAEFVRYSCLPTWTYNNWILDRKQSGGCPLDMHIHDVDLINYFFGMPKAVRSYSTHNKTSFESIFTTYEYDKIFVTASADWSLPQQYPFQAKAFFTFEKGAIELVNDIVTVYTDDAKYILDYDKTDQFYKEMREFVACATEQKVCEKTDCFSVMRSIKLVEAEIESAENAGKIVTV